MHSKRKIPDSRRTGWKAKACTSFVLYLKVFENHLYYIWHVRVLSIKPCLHTQLPEHNKSYRSFPGVGAFDHLEWTYDGAFEQLFGLGRGEFGQKFSKNLKSRGLPRGMLKLRFDWYITQFHMEPLNRQSSCVNVTGPSSGASLVAHLKQALLPSWDTFWNRITSRQVVIPDWNYQICTTLNHKICLAGEATQAHQ